MPLALVFALARSPNVCFLCWFLTGLAADHQRSVNVLKAYLDLLRHNRNISFLKLAGLLAADARSTEIAHQCWASTCSVHKVVHALYCSHVSLGVRRTWIAHGLSLVFDVAAAGGLHVSLGFRHTWIAHGLSLVFDVAAAGGLHVSLGFKKIWIAHPLSLTFDGAAAGGGSQFPCSTAFQAAARQPSPGKGSHGRA